MQKQRPQEASQVATEDVATRIERILASHNTVVFMKRCAAAAAAQQAAYCQATCASVQPATQPLRSGPVPMLVLNSPDCLHAGTPAQPRCGFSQKVVGMLQSIQEPFESFDILTDEEVRQGIKQLKQWPTFPQLYVRGELIGGCDIPD